MPVIANLVLTLAVLFAPHKPAAACKPGARPECCATECCIEAKPATPAKACCSVPFCPDWLCHVLGCAH